MTDAQPTDDPTTVLPAAASAGAPPERNANLLIGALAVLLACSFVLVAVLFGRVASAQRDADAARSELAAISAGGTADAASSDELEQIRDDVARVEAGAALYASQIDGFQEQLTDLAPEIEAGVTEAITGLQEFGESTITFDVDIDEVIPIDTEVVINRTVQVPINTEIPINEEIETTIRIDAGLGTIPLDITVPVDIVVPIDLTVDIPINETVPVRDEFPIMLTVPIAIDVGDTELKNLTDSLATGLMSLQDVLTGLSSSG